MESSKRIERIIRVLRPGENLLWYGTPSTEFRALQGDGFFVPFSLFFGAGTLLWDFYVANAHATFSHVLGALFATPLSVYLIFGVRLQNQYNRGAPPTRSPTSPHTSRPIA